MLVFRVKCKCIKFLNFAALELLAMSFKDRKQLNLAQPAQDILSFWEDQSIFEKSVSTREGHPP